MEKKKARFREFLKVIGASKENKQSWNDNFSAFMADEGSGLVNTSKTEKKRKAKEQEKKEKQEAPEEGKEEKIEGFDE